MNIREASNIYLGLAAISEVYYGSTKLWPANYANNYLTITNTSANTATWNIRIPTQVNATMLPSISFSFDNGATWTTHENDSSKTENMTIAINITAGGSVLLKANATRLGTSSTATENTRMFGASTNNGATWTISGNILSLVYGDNFVGKTSLPSGTTSYDYWFAYLFSYNNASMHYQITDASNLILPLMNVPNYGYYSMFMNCRGLVAGPSLSTVTSLGSDCFYGMFYNCYSLATAPELPSVTSMNSGSYRFMFQNCTLLTETPTLDFSNCTTFYGYACYCMFSGCTSLTKINGDIIINANSVSGAQPFGLMFKDCTALTETCDIALSSNANQTVAYFYCMFQNCSSLNKIYISSDWTAPVSNTFTTDWVKNVAASGTFYDNTTDHRWKTWGDSYIPTGWTRVPEYIDYKNQYLTIETADNSNVEFKFYINSNSSLSYIEYSVDNGTNWTKLSKSSSTVNTTTPSTNKVMLRGSGTATGFNDESNSGLRLTVSGNDNKTCIVSGNINSLLYPDLADFSDLDNYSSSYAFTNLFLKQNYYACNFFVTDASNLILPKYSNTRSYYQMFKDQTQLVSPPDMTNVTILASYAAHSMFKGCTALTTSPDLSSLSTVAGYGCYAMFEGCTALTHLQQLGKTLGTINFLSGNYNMSRMFYGCTALVDASTCNFKMVNVAYVANATNQYSYMFSGCTSLTTCFNIELVLNATVTYICAFMFNGCSSMEKSPTITNYRTSTSVTDANGFRYCFQDCTKLSTVYIGDETNYYTNGVFYRWLNNVASTGYFVNDSSVTFDSSSTSGVPSGWTLM